MISKKGGNIEVRKGSEWGKKTDFKEDRKKCINREKQDPKAEEPKIDEFLFSKGSYEREYIEKSCTPLF